MKDFIIMPTRVDQINQILSNTNKIGFWGVEVEIGISKLIAIQLELNFVQKGYYPPLQFF